MQRDDRFPRDHLTRRNAVPEGAWIGPGFLVGLGLWAVIVAAIWAVM